ncbi:MAG: CBS domain-containing protein [Proteobacteria bacterium]|nr:CBS domain-containing protein [Pseudomonadota bacterium]
MKTLSQIISEGKRAVCCVGPKDSVRRALELMAQEDVGALLVMDQDKLVGIFSERDYTRKGILHGKSSLETQVHEIMTARVTCIAQDKTVEEAMAIMSEKNFRHLPVLDGKSKVVGVVSIRDLIKETISEQAFIIKQLESYVQG